MPTILKHLETILRDSAKVSISLLKILIPAIIVVRLLDLIGAAELLASTLGAPLELLGLPAIAGLIWATTIVTNIYAGLIVLFTFPEAWTLGQITTLGVLMLGAHNFIVELSVAYKGRCRILPMFLIRILGGYGLAAILSYIYADIPEMQTPVAWNWTPEAVDNSWSGWLSSQIEMLFWTQVVILGLVAMLHIAKITGFERLLEKLLKPVLRVIGIRENALPMSLIGMTLGLAYGGGLLIREAEKGTLAPRDIFASFALLGLCHSLIEDTLLISLTGAELSGILWARLAWALLLIAIITRILPRIPDAWLQRHLVR